MKALVSLSGGIDSTVTLAQAVHDGREVQAVTFRYGSKHNALENKAAADVAGYYNVLLHTIDLTAIMAGFPSALMQDGPAIPEGHYQAESMRQTVVPGRNTIFAAILLGMAQSSEAGEVWLGIHAGDHFIYPDCRPEWTHGVDFLMLSVSEGKIHLQTPFLRTDKEFIIRKGLILKVPFHLTRTCYTDNPIACGRCGSCVERRSAFLENGIEDPIEYQKGQG